MTRVQLAEQVLADTRRIADHLRLHDAADVDARIDEIFDALDLLTRHPLIGRPAGNGMREFVIGRGARGYLARYRYDARDDVVQVLALRAQREAGFTDD